MSKSNMSDENGSVAEQQRNALVHPDDLKLGVSSQDLTHSSQESIFRSLKKVLDHSFTDGELFLKLATKLDKIFLLNRTSLALYDETNDLLRIPYIKAGREFHKGVQINFTASQTMFKEVLDEGTVFVFDFPQQIRANLLEKKILIDQTSRSLAIMPLICGRRKIGTFNMSSRTFFAFNLLESHLFDHFFAKTAEKLAELPR